MSTAAYRLASLGIDFKDRVKVDTTVDASPADATETIIATLEALGPLRQDQGVLVACNAAFTVGTNGTSARLRVRRTNVSGTVVADSDAVLMVAATKREVTVLGFDALGAVGNQVYVATLTMGAATAASTVAFVTLVAMAV